MKLKSDTIKIRTVPFDDEGNKIEPEQQLVTRAIDTPATLTGSNGGQALGQLPVEFVAQMSAAEVAAGLRRMCRGCVHFDHARWVRIIEGVEQSRDPLDFEAVQQVREGLLRAGVTGVEELADQIKILGRCNALTEEMKEPVTVHPEACCPAHTITPTTPNGYFKPRDPAQGGAAYDGVMNRAAGKIR